MVFFDPGHIAKNLAYNPVITTGNLEFDHHEILLSVQREYINEAAADWKLYSGNAFVLIELKAGSRCARFFARKSRRSLS